MANGQAGADTVGKPKEIERIQHRIDGTCEQLSQAADRFERLSDKIQGCIPRDTEKLKKTDAPEVPAGGLAAVNHSIDRMSFMSDRIFQVLDRLEELA